MTTPAPPAEQTEQANNKDLSQPRPLAQFAESEKLFAGRQAGVRPTTHAGLTAPLPRATQSVPAQTERQEPQPEADPLAQPVAEEAPAEEVQEQPTGPSQEESQEWIARSRQQRDALGRQVLAQKRQREAQQATQQEGLATMPTTERAPANFHAPILPTAPVPFSSGSEYQTIKSRFDRLPDLDDAWFQDPATLEGEGTPMGQGGTRLRLAGASRAEVVRVLTQGGFLASEDYRIVEQDEDSLEVVVLYDADVDAVEEELSFLGEVDRISDTQEDSEAYEQSVQDAVQDRNRYQDTSPAARLEREATPLRKLACAIGRLRQLDEKDGLGTEQYERLQDLVDAFDELYWTPSGPDLQECVALMHSLLQTGNTANNTYQADRALLEKLHQDLKKRIKPAGGIYFIDRRQAEEAELCFELAQGPA